MLRLLDTATGETRPLEARESGEIGLYVCGPTVYGPPHIGHGRATLVYDILRRYLEWSGQVVRHVSNVTDIDDKIINVAVTEKRSWQDVAVGAEDTWWDAMDRMGVLRPHVVPHATEYIPEMVELVARLVEAEVAYETAEGVYLSVANVPGYGLLAHQSLDSLRAGARVEVNEDKRAPVDFALWKKAKPDEPSWPAPFGPGRPGWHTECVVMSLALLGDGFALHGGGEDLKFPHHENERAQAVALGQPFARHWIHHGMILLGQEKMSKSLGNIVDLRRMLEVHDPRAYRLVVLQGHYREQMKVDETRIADASRTLSGLDALGRRLEEAARDGGSAPPSPDVLDGFKEQMDADLGTPRAVATLFDAVRRANIALDRRETEVGVSLARGAMVGFDVLGLAPVGSAEVSDSALELARRRDAARASGDYAAADGLRDELVALGYRVEDTPSGTRVLR